MLTTVRGGGGRPVGDRAGPRVSRRAPRRGRRAGRRGPSRQPRPRSATARIDVDPGGQLGVGGDPRRLGSPSPRRRGRRWRSRRVRRRRAGRGGRSFGPWTDGTGVVVPRGFEVAGHGGATSSDPRADRYRAGSPAPRRSRRSRGGTRRAARRRRGTRRAVAARAPSIDRRSITVASTARGGRRSAMLEIGEARLGPSSSPSQLVEAGVGGHPVGPGRERRPAVEAGDALVIGDQRLLGGVGGVGVVARPGAGKPPRSGRSGGAGGCRARAVARLGCGDERPVVGVGNDGERVRRAGSTQGPRLRSSSSISAISTRWGGSPRSVIHTSTKRPSAPPRSNVASPSIASSVTTGWPQPSRSVAASAAT